MNRAYRIIAWNLFFAVLGSMLFLPAVTNPVWAQDDTTEDEIIPIGISPLSNRTALLSFPLSVYPFNQPNTMPTIRLQELAEITVVLEDKTEGLTSLSIDDDFLPLSTSAINSGLALYKESESKRGFSYSVEDQNKDLPIDLKEKPIVTKDPVVPGRFTITFRPVAGSSNVQLPFFRDQFADFYVVARTSLNLRQGDRFEAYIPANGIVIRDLRNTLVDDTLYDDRFPSDAFADLNLDFTTSTIYEGDIVTIVNLITDTEGKNRIDASSQPTTILGLDMVGREDEGYFLEEVRVNFLGINLAGIARLVENLTQQGTSAAGFYASAQMGQMEQVGVFYHPTFFYSPWFYNTPIDMTTGQALTTIAPGDGETEIPMTMPLDMSGFPEETFMIGMDNPYSHYTSYVAYGPRLPGAYGLTPRVVTQDIFKALQANSEGGIFLFRELGGTAGQYDSGVDHLISLDTAGFRVESFEVSAEAASDSTSPLYSLMRRIFPGVIAGDSGKNVIPALYGDDNLATLLMGVSDMPDPVDGARPPLGSLDCTMDPDCYFFDLMINVLRPYMGLTEGQIRYLFNYTEGNGRTNFQDLFDYDLVQGFTFVLPVAKNNAMSDLQAPANKTGSNAGSDVYVAIRTSDNLRNLDTIIPFIQPKDVTIGNQVASFTKGNLENVSSYQSVSSIGYGRANTSSTYSIIGRPRPRFNYQDLTQPGEGELAGNTNILYDASLSSPPKAIIGIDAVDLGQNPLLVDNHESLQKNLFDTFFTESTVFGEIQIDFLPGTNSTTFDPTLFTALPLEIGIDVQFSRFVSSHSVALYYDDDTPSGNGRDDDGDGLVDEEWYNLQDDDGDGLIDEDFGDYDPAGTNGIFDAMDHYIPIDDDRYGGYDAAPAYAFTPNSLTKFQDYITALQATDETITANDGELLPLTPSEGSYFAELDIRALNFPSYIYPRSMVFWPNISRFSDYNQGMSSYMEPRTGFLDLVAAFRSLGGDFAEFPYFPEDLFIETPDTGDIIWLLTLTGGDGLINPVSDPDGDARKSFALSLNNALRVPHPQKGFIRVGWTPMVVQVSEIGGVNVSDPQGDSQGTLPYHQFGIDIVVADGQAIGDYMEGIIDTLSDAYDTARQAVADYEQAVADAEDSAASEDPPGEPDYPDPPEPTEISLTSPLTGLNIESFIETDDGNYNSNYQFLLQIPDENFGPLAGNDYFVVLRSSPTAQVGETFRARIRSGAKNSTIAVTDTDAGTITYVAKPQGGISYYSYLETDFGATANSYANVSKNQITTSEIVIQSLNVAPSLTFRTPKSGKNLADDDFEFGITFTAEDPDNVAQIQLYADTDNLNFDGTFIPGAILREGFDTGFVVNLLEDIDDFDPTLSYYIYARLDDGVNSPVYVYSDGPISTTAASEGDSGGSSGGGTIVEGELSNPLDYIKLSSDGSLFSKGNAAALTKITATTRVVDMEVTANFAGYIEVQVDGTVLGNGDLGTALARYLQPNGSFIFPTDKTYFYKNTLTGSELIKNPTESQITIESARDIEVDFTNGAIYVLDGDGDMLLMGNPSLNLLPNPVGIDMYRDMELGPDGKQMYFLTGNGILSAVGNASIPSWSNLIQGDKYRDLSLRVRSGVITHIVITDNDGMLTVLGSGDTVKSTLLSLTPEADGNAITAGSVRQVKLFPDTDEIVMLVEGSGRIIYLTKGQVISKPSDTLIYSDEEGLDDDRIVDVETTAVNLQSVVTIVRDIIDSFANENSSRIMAYVSSDYKDKSGLNATNLQVALNTFFKFYEIDNYAETKRAATSFLLTNQGDTVTAQVLIDFSGWYPIVTYYTPDVDPSATSGETTATQFFNDTTISFDQDLVVREVSDGRGWLIDLYEIRNYGRRFDDLYNSEDLEYTDYIYLQRLSKNKRLGSYVPRKEGIDDYATFFLDINEDSPLEPFNVMAIFREPYLTRNAQPPVFEYSTYTGSFLSVSPLEAISYVFSRAEDGSVKLISMNMPQIMSTNDSTYLTVDAESDTENPLGSLDGTEIESPFGFSFEQRGPVRAIFRGEADLSSQDGTTLDASFPSGGIMMLPENTDIFTINPSVYVSTNITRTTVKTNPYDPQRDSLTSNGFQASLVAGRSYLVIAKDGKHYGFITIPSNAQSGLDLDPPIIQFEFRYEDAFILPSTF